MILKYIWKEIKHLKLRSAYFILETETRCFDHVFKSMIMMVMMMWCMYFFKDQFKGGKSRIKMKKRT